MDRRRLRLLVRTEVRRRLRAAAEKPSTVLGAGVAVLFGTVFGLGVIVGAYFAGRAVAAGEVSWPIPAAGSAAGGLLALVVFMVGLRVVQQSAEPAAPEHVLLAAEHREVVAALVLVEAFLPSAMIGVPGVLAAIVFAIGFGSPASALPLAAAVLSLVALGTVGGFVAGLGVRNALARSRLLARFRTAFAFLLGIGYFVVIFGGGFENVFAPILFALGGPPLSWFADLALLGVFPTTSPLGAAGALLTTLLGVVLLGAVTSRLAASLWYDEPVDPGHGEGGASSIGSLPRVDRTRAVVIRKTWTRARRSPIRLVYVGYPLLFAVGPIVSSGLGSVPPSAVPAVVVYGAWGAGAAFTLNPIGDETPVLPITVTSGVDGRRFVGALWLAGALVAVPVTAAVAVAAGLLAGVGPLDLLAAGVVAVALAGLAPGVATGIGAAFPRTQPARVSRNRRVVVPSIVAFGIYSVVLLLLATPASLALHGPVRATLAGAIGAPETAVLAGFGLASVLVAGGVAVASYRVAAGRFDAYTVD